MTMNTHERIFPPFSLTRLLSTVFDPKPGERIALLIDLAEPSGIKEFAFLRNRDLSIQRHAYEVFYQGLKNGGLAELGLQGGDLFAYQVTGGSNLDLPDLAVDPNGRELSFEKDIYPKFNIILCISTFSATAPLTAFAKRFDSAAPPCMVSTTSSCEADSPSITTKSAGRRSGSDWR